MTDLELFQILRPHVMAVSGCPEVILAAQNKNAPKGSYGSIQPRYRVDERGQANIYTKGLLGDTIETDVRPQQVITCVVEFFREGSKLFASRLQQMGRREDVAWPLFQKGISIRNVSATSDLTALQSSNYEERSRVEVVLWYESSSKYVVNEIKAVEVISELDIGVIVDDRIIPDTFPQPEINELYVNRWANRIYFDARLGF